MTDKNGKVTFGVIPFYSSSGNIMRMGDFIALKPDLKKKQKEKKSD
jgi:hypothetical protein